MVRDEASTALVDLARGERSRNEGVSLNVAQAPFPVVVDLGLEMLGEARPGAVPSSLVHWPSSHASQAMLNNRA